jgi:hypothetical protein
MKQQATLREQGKVNTAAQETSTTDVAANLTSLTEK